MDFFVVVHGFCMFVLKRLDFAYIWIRCWGFFFFNIILLLNVNGISNKDGLNKFLLIAVSLSNINNWVKVWDC